MAIAMQGSIDGDNLLLNISGLVLQRKIRFNQDDVMVFKDGSLLEGEDGIIKGGIIIKQKKYFINGTKDSLLITTRSYKGSPGFPPYRGFVIDGEVRLRLYEPTIFSISLEDLENGKVKIKGIYYVLEMGLRDFFVVRPISQRSAYEIEI